MRILIFAAVVVLTTAAHAEDFREIKVRIMPIPTPVPMGQLIPNPKAEEDWLRKAWAAAEAEQKLQPVPPRRPPWWAWLIPVFGYLGLNAMAVLGARVLAKRRVKLL